MHRDTLVRWIASIRAGDVYLSLDNQAVEDYGAALDDDDLYYMKVVMHSPHNWSKVPMPVLLREMGIDAPTLPQTFYSLVEWMNQNVAKTDEIEWCDQWVQARAREHAQKQWLTPAQFAAAHGYNPEVVRQLCRAGKIPGAQKFGPAWLIPSSAERIRPQKRGRKRKQED